MRGKAISLVALLFFSTMTVPSARAAGIAYCDVVATRCTGAAVFSTRGCAKGSFDLGIFGDRKFEVCADVTSAAAAAGVLGIPEGVISGRVLLRDERGDYLAGDNCGALVPLFVWGSCATSVAAMGCAIGQAAADATHAGGSIPSAMANARSCSVQEYACLLVDSVCYAQLPCIPQICQHSTLGDLPEQARTQLLNVLAANVREGLERQLPVAPGPHGQEIRETLIFASVDAVKRLPDGSEVTVFFQA